MIHFKTALIASACAAAFVSLIAPAAAQSRLEARYTASLAGIPVGKGTWTIEVADDYYFASSAGGSSGLLNTFAGGKGSGATQGKVVGGLLQPQTYTVSSTSAKKTEEIRLGFVGTAVKDVSITPEPPVDAQRIPVTDAHKRNVVDPMTGALLRMSAPGDTVGPESCRATTPIFDGRMRYDLRFEFKRIEQVKSETGYRGPVAVCAVFFTPIAGYIPDRAAIKYLAQRTDMEAWLAPIAGARTLVPYRVTVPTPLGTAMLEATHFVTTPLPPRAAARTQ